MSWVGAWLGATVIEAAAPDPDPPAPVEVDIEHSELEVIDYVAHALGRLPRQYRGDP